MTIRKICAVLLAAVMLLTCAACTPKTEPVDKNQLTLNTTTTTATTQSTTEKPNMDLNPLTGEYDITPGTDTRPVAFMIGNNAKSRPQYGIEDADMYFEGETEAGITRIMAVFAGTDHIPAQLGPNRSARTPFLQIANSIDAIYSHAGGSKAAKAVIATKVVDNINALVYDGTTYWRDKTLRAQKGLEYSMMTSGKNIAERIKKLGYSTTTNRAVPFQFGAPKGDGAGEQVQIRFSKTQTIGFKYDKETNLYTKYNGTLENGAKHVVADGDVITATNIFVIYADKYAENNKTINFKFANGGTGWAISGGKSREIRYELTGEKMTFFETDGSVAAVQTGKSYVCFVENGERGNTILK